MTIGTELAFGSLLDAPLWFLGTCRDGIPNVVPIGFKWVEEGGLLIADLFLGKTRENLLHNPEVAVSVAALDPKRGIQIKGTARIHTEGEVFARVRGRLAPDGLDNRLVSVIEVTPRRLFLLDPGAAAGQELPWPEGAAFRPAMV